MARMHRTGELGARYTTCSPGTLGGLSNVDNGLLLCRWHHGKVHDGLPDDQRWQITLDPTTGDVTVSRPGGEPYELGPSQPYRPTTQNTSDHGST